jgi:predicted metal-binding protein
MHTLSVCRTCPRGGIPETGLRERLRALLADTAASALQLLLVECVGSCPRPCAVAFDAPGKWRIRLSGLTPAHADDIVTALRSYAGSADGSLPNESLPAGLRGHISARSPTFAYPKTLPPTGAPSPFSGGIVPPPSRVPCQSDA